MAMMWSPNGSISVWIEQFVLADNVTIDTAQTDNWLVFADHILRPTDGRYRLIEQEQLIIAVLFVETDIRLLFKRLKRPLGHQSFVGSRDILTELRGAIHFITLSEIRTDRIHVSVANANAAFRWVIGGKF